MKYMLIFESHSDLNGDFSFLRKEPKYLPLFKKLLNDKEENRTTLHGLEVLYSQIQTHRNTLKQNKINILDAKTLEDVDDMLSRAMWIEKYNKFTKLLPKYLRTEIRGNEELSKKFKEYINEFEYEEYKNIFLTKVVKYKNTDQLFDAMDKYLSGNVEKRQLVKDINNDPSIRIYSDENDVLVTIVYSKKASCKYGSSQWCISNSRQNYWNSYVPDKNGVQYFIWDFNKKGTDPLSKIGVTIYDKNDYVAHDKSDYSIKFDEIPVSEGDLKSYNKIDKDDYEMMMIFNEELLEKGRGITKSFKNDEQIEPEFGKKLLKYNSDLFFKVSDSRDLDFVTDDELIEYATDNNKLLINFAVYKRISKHIYPIINNDHTLGNLYEILRKDPFSDMGDIMDKIVDNLTDEQKYELIDKDVTLLKVDHFTDRINQKKLESYIDEFPQLIFHDSIEGKLSIEKYKELCLKFPEIYTKVSNILDTPIDISEDEYRMMIHKLFERFNEGEYTKDWGSYRSNDFDSSRDSISDVWENYPKLEYLKDDDFVYSLFDDSEHLSRMLRFLYQLLTELPLEYINRLYWDYDHEIENIYNSGMNHIRIKGGSELFNSLKSYYSNEGQIARFDDEDLYVFNARYEKQKVGENPRNGKALYEEILSIERMLLYTPFKSTFVKMMKMRAMMQGDLKTYGLWVTKGLMVSFSSDGGESIVNSDLDDSIIDLIDERKFEM